MPGLRGGMDMNGMKTGRKKDIEEAPASVIVEINTLSLVEDDDDA